ncbi:MAG: glycosyltransferase family 4 protein [Thermotogae bacterium]|nr:glycosyltransferase family 4 protein [Thermotogota bacterium]
MRLKLLVITPWTDDWMGRVRRFPEVKFLKRKLESLYDYDVVAPGERPPKDRYDVIFVQSERAYSHGRKLRREVGARRFVVAIYGVFERFPLRRVFWPLHMWRYRHLDAAFKGGADLYLITDDGSRGERLAERYGRPYVMLPVPKPPWGRVGRLEARTALGLPPDGPIGGFAGALNKLKGAHMLENILKRSRGTYKLAVIGDGPLLPKVRRLAERYPGRVFILTPLPYERMNLFYSAVDFVLAPYLYGNKTAVVVESLTLGVPVVAFRAHSSDEIIRHGWNGFLAENFSVEEFAHYTVRLATDPILRETMGGAARISSEGFPTWDARITTIVQSLHPL